MEPPKIRISRYEHSVAIKWPEDENWYRFDPEDIANNPAADRHKVGPLRDDWAPDHEWIDPFNDPRPDIKRWTVPLRRVLQEALRLLDGAESHPWSG